MFFSTNKTKNTVISTLEIHSLPHLSLSSKTVKRRSERQPDFLAVQIHSFSNEVFMKDLLFEDRSEAGRELASALISVVAPKESPIVLGIPRGGVLVATEIAQAFNAPLDIIVARKIRAPDRPEVGIGAVVNGAHISLVNESLARTTGATPGYINREISFQSLEIEKTLRFYRGDRPPVEIFGKTVIVVDDGIATGYTLRAALEGLRLRNPARLIAAVPVASRDSFKIVKVLADEAVCLNIPEAFLAVGCWYENFEKFLEDRVLAILHRNWFHASLQSLDS